MSLLVFQGHNIRNGNIYSATRTPTLALQAPFQSKNEQGRPG